MAKRGICIALIVVTAAFLSACHTSSAGSARQRLNGTWQSDAMMVTIDFPNHKYQGVALGQPFSEPLKLISEQANIVTFKAGNSTIVCQIQADGKIMLTKQGATGGIPILLTRAGS